MCVGQLAGARSHNLGARRHAPGPFIVVLVLDIERGLGMQCRNNPRARIDGTPNALGEAFLEDEDDDEDEDDCEGRWRAFF
jgi:hypothetical protein